MDSLAGVMSHPSRQNSKVRRPRISVGIGSWTDAEYTPLVFPKGVKSDERLKVYATRFDHVEVNSSYHAFPRRAWVENWAKQTPEGFVFDFKLHKRFSENPAASAGDEALVSQLLATAQPLIDAKKLGAFFLIMPPSFVPGRRHLEELDGVAEKLQPHLLAVELRHRGWMEAEQREQTLDYFRARKLVWIAVDMPRVEGSTIMPPVDEVTNPRLAYLRLHGRRNDWPKLKTAEERHTYEYPANELKEIAARVRGLAEKADEVHVVANNHAEDFAPKAALALQRLLGLERERERESIGGADAGDLLPGF